MRGTTIVLAGLLAAGSAFAQCSPYGWVKVDEKVISMTERLCVYEKSGVRLSIIVSGFCPFSPC